MVYQIKNITNSNKNNKRLKIIAINKDLKYNDSKYKKYIDFGDKYGNTYLDHKDEELRINYFNRHYNNKKEKRFIDNLIMSPSLLSLFILWGPFDNIINNIILLNKILMKYDKFDKDMILTKKYFYI
jgi:hypothetical protein